MMTKLSLFRVFSLVFLNLCIQLKGNKVIVSTDISVGLKSHPEISSANVISEISPCDDGLALAYMINQPDVFEILAVMPIMGNAPLIPEMHVARTLLYELKNEYSIPIFKGASGPLQDPYKAASQWAFENNPINLFQYPDCVNPAVIELKEYLDDNPNNITVVLIGPFTDLACLLGVYPESINNIKSVIALASQDASKPMVLNNEMMTDRNVLQDTLSAAYVISILGSKLKLISFSLSSQTSDMASSRYISVDSHSLVGPSASLTPNSTKFFLNAVELYNQHNTDGLWDQYVSYALKYPGNFQCDTYFVYVQQFEYDNYRSTKFNVSAILTYSKNYRGPVVAGSGNLSSFSFSTKQALSSIVCTDFKNDFEFIHFKHDIFKWMW